MIVVAKNFSVFKLETSAPADGFDSEHGNSSRLDLIEFDGPGNLRLTAADGASRDVTSSSDVEDPWHWGRIGKGFYNDGVVIAGNATNGEEVALNGIESIV